MGILIMGILIMGILIMGILILCANPPPQLFAAYYNLLDQTVRQADSQFAAFSDLQETSLR